MIDTVADDSVVLSTSLTVNELLIAAAAPFSVYARVLPPAPVTGASLTLTMLLVAEEVAFSGVPPLSVWLARTVMALPTSAWVRV